MSHPMAILHAEMPRQGPGCADDVAWAVRQAQLSGAVRIIDAGCGPGADLETFADLLPDAQLSGIDAMPHLVQEAQIRLGTRAQITQGDMAQLTGPVDLIWCAGAIYFLGVTKALGTWRAALAPGAFIAFSEPVLPDDPSEIADMFWAEYSAITDGAGLTARIEAAGFSTFAQRDIVGAPWGGYYAALERRVEMLSTKADPALADVLSAAKREIELWSRAPDQIIYRLSLVRVMTG